MKARLILMLLSWLVKLGHEFVTAPAPEPTPAPTPLARPPVEGTLAEYAESMVRWVEAKTPNAPDAYKRAVVYNRLVKAFPAERRRDLSLALELAVRAVKP